MENKKPELCGAFLGVRGSCVLKPNHNGDHVPERPYLGPPARESNHDDVQDAAAGEK